MLCRIQNTIQINHGRLLLFSDLENLLFHFYGWIFGHFRLYLKANLDMLMALGLVQHASIYVWWCSGMPRDYFDLLKCLFITSGFAISVDFLMYSTMYSKRSGTNSMCRTIPNALQLFFFSYCTKHMHAQLLIYIFFTK